MSSEPNEAEIEQNDIYGYVGGIAYVCYSLVILVLFLINTVKVYQDFFTTERASVSKLKRQPKLTPVYASLAAQTQASIFFFLVADIIQGTSYGFAHTQNACDSIQTAAGMTYQVGKTFLYLLFLWRLHRIYEPTPFAVSLNKIIGVSTLIVMYNVMVMVVMATVWTSTRLFTYEGLKKFPNYCDAPLEPVTAALIAVQEVVISVGFLYVFYRQLSLALAASPTQCDPAVTYAGRQLFVITTVSMVSAVVLVLLTTATGYSFIVGADAVISVISMILFMPYYSTSCYRYCCCCCRVCLDKFVCCDTLRTKDDAAQIEQGGIEAPLLTLHSALDPEQKTDATKKSVQMEEQAQSGAPIEDNADGQTEVVFAGDAGGDTERQEQNV